MTDVGDATPTKGTGAASGLLSRKVGGVKVQWLILIAAVAVVGGILYRRYKAARTPAVTVTAPTTASIPDTTTTGDGVYSTAGGTNLGGGFAYSGNGSGTSTYSTLATNAQWSTAAANGLIAQGQFAPLDIENALANYLTGAPLTPAQTAIINTAAATYGSPPEAVLASTTTVAPSTISPVTGYVRRSDGEISETYADGTKKPLTYPEWEQLAAQGANYKSLSNQQYTAIPNKVTTT